MKKLLLILLVISSQFSVAQTLKATLGQPTQLPLRLFNQKSDKCNIDVIYPDGGSVQYDVSKPEYSINIPFTPNAEGLASFSWEGKFRMRGFASLFACEGNGKLSVYVVPTNEVKMQRWKELGSKVSESQKSCLSTALNKASIAFAWEGLDKDIPVDVNEPAVKEIRGVCEKYSDYSLKQNISCKIGKLQSTCNEALQVTIEGVKKQIALGDIGEYISPKNKIEIVEVELDEAKVKRQQEQALVDEKSKKDQEEAKAKEVRDFPYTLNLSCQLFGRNVQTAMCFLKSEGGLSGKLEIRNGSDYAMYSGYEIQMAIRSKLGDTKEGVFVKLRENFEILAQGSAADSKVTIKIIENSTGKPLFIKSGTQFQPVAVSN